MKEGSETGGDSIFASCHASIRQVKSNGYFNNDCCNHSAIVTMMLGSKLFSNYSLAPIHAPFYGLAVKRGVGLKLCRSFSFLFPILNRRIAGYGSNRTRYPCFSVFIWILFDVQVLE